MDLITRRFRGAFIAIVVLGLSATAVFAGHVVLQAPATSPTAAEQGDQDNQADETDNETPDANETPEAPETPEPADTADTGTPPDGTHGALVSAAAQMPTPAGFANHGAFVSCVAHMPALTPGTTPAQALALVTPDTCAAAAAADQAAKDAAKADRQHGKHGKGHNRT